MFLLPFHRRLILYHVSLVSSASSFSIGKAGTNSISSESLKAYTTQLGTWMPWHLFQNRPHIIYLEVGFYACKVSRLSTFLQWEAYYVAVEALV